MVIGNHLTYQGKKFGEGLTFRRGASWISEIDMCIVKEKNVILMLKLILPYLFVNII